jgi:hypothetical protein
LRFAMQRGSHLGDIAQLNAAGGIAQALRM